MDISDAELVARAQAGDVDAFAVLVERHRGTVVRLVRQFVLSADDAHDMAQETFVSAFQHLSDLRDGEKFGAWLRRIAVNAARQWRRHEAQMSLETLWDESDATRLNGNSPSDPSAERVREIVRDALTSLPPEQHSAVLLHYFDGYDYGEIAALLQVPVNTVRGRLHQARRKLREEMSELAPAKAKGKRQKAKEWEFALTAEDLKALRGAAMLASREPLQPILQTICIEPDGTLVSTDVHRLFIYRGSSIKPPLRVLVLSSLCGRLLYHSDLSEARLTITDKEAILRCVNEHDTSPEHLGRAPLVTYEMYPDKYPTYEKVIPTSWKLTASLSARDLLTALDEVARFEAFLASVAVPDSGRDGLKVVLTFSGQNGLLWVRDVAFKSEPVPTRWMMHSTIPVTVDGLKEDKGFAIAGNRFYLRECLQALSVTPDERLEMRFSDPLGPMLVKPEGVGNRFVVMMPMSILPSERAALEPPR